MEVFGIGHVAEEHRDADIAGNVLEAGLQGVELGVHVRHDHVGTLVEAQRRTLADEVAHIGIGVVADDAVGGTNGPARTCEVAVAVVVEVLGVGHSDITALGVGQHGVGGALGAAHTGHTDKVLRAGVEVVDGVGAVGNAGGNSLPSGIAD